MIRNPIWCFYLCVLYYPQSILSWHDLMRWNPAWHERNFHGKWSVSPRAEPRSYSDMWTSGSAWGMGWGGWEHESKMSISLGSYSYYVFVCTENKKLRQKDIFITQLNLSFINYLKKINALLDFFLFYFIFSKTLLVYIVYDEYTGLCTVL